MSLFAGLDVANADIPKPNPGTFPGFLSDYKQGPTKAGDKYGALFTFTYQETEGGRKWKVTNWQRTPDPSDFDPNNVTDDEKTWLGYLKAVLTKLGVPEARMNTITREDLIGTEVFVTVKEGDGDFPVFVNVAPRDESGSLPATADSGFLGL